MTNEKIMDKIRCMMALTTENGATEEEAVNAARMIGKLLSKYNISKSELEIRNEARNCKEEMFNIGERSEHPIVFAITAIAEYTGVKVLLMTNPQGKKGKFVNFFRMPHEVEVAIYFTALCMSTIETEWKAFTKTAEFKEVQKTHRNSRIRTSFKRGMALTLYQRFKEMNETNEKEVAAEQSTSLIVLKNAVVDEEYAKKTANMRIKTTKSRAKMGDTDAFFSGMEAGKKVELNPAVT